MGNASTVANSSPDPVIPAPPQTAAVTQAAEVPPVTDKYEQSGKAKWAGIVNGLVAGGVPRLNQIVNEAHQRRMADMDMYQNMSGTAAKVLQSGKDPNTGEPLKQTDSNGKVMLDSNGKELLTPAGQKWQFQHDKAWGEYQKIAGITPEGKNILGRIGMLAHHVIHGGTKQDEASQQAAPATGGPIPAPPGKAAPAPVPTNVASALPPPPGGAVNPSNGATGAAPVTPAMQAAPMDLRTLAQGSPLTAARLAESEALRSETAKKSAEYEFQKSHSPVALYKSQLESAFPDMKPDDIQRNAMLAAHFFPAGSTKIAAWGRDADGNPVPLMNVGGQLVPMSEAEGTNAVPASLLKPRKAFAKDEKGIYSVAIDPSTNKEIPGTQNRGELPPAYAVSKVRTGFHYWTDDDGNIHQTPTTTSTSPALGGGGGSRRPSAVPPPPGGVKGDNVIGHTANAYDKQDYHIASTAIAKATDDYQHAKSRMRTMDLNAPAALAGNQQAMLSLVAQHIGMTLGAQKGARITRSVWEEAMASAPWLDQKLAHFFKTDPVTGDRTLISPLSGVVLTNDQVKQMVGLAHEKVATVKQDLDDVNDTYKDVVAKRNGRAAKAVPAPPSGTKNINDAIMDAVAAAKGKK